MDQEPSALLDEYEARCERARPWHPVLLEAARDHHLPTAFLIDRTLAWVRALRAGDEDLLPDFALLVLHERVEPAVLQTLLGLLGSVDPAERQLAAVVLREFPGLDRQPQPHSPVVVEALERLVEVEQDEEVLAGALSAIGWQKLPAGTAILLRFADHESGWVRDVVANNLLMGCAEEEPVPPQVAEALLGFTRDPDEDIRWSVFFDVAEYPELFAPYREAFVAAARAATSDEDHTVREQAQRAVGALLRSGGPSPD